MISWIKRNKLATVLLLVVAYFIVKSFLGSRITPLYNSSSGFGVGGAEMNLKTAAPNSSRSFLPSPDYTPTQTTDRMVVQESNLSMVVKDVRDSSDKAIEYAKSINGYMVSSSMNQPEEAPYAYVVLRIPAKNLKAATDYFRSLSIKVSSESLLGTDVTDQYTDLNARLDTLNKTKAKFDAILGSAVSVQDILTVQREIINLQSQIDAIKGQQLYLEKTSELARISLNLSTDEFSLPYAPTDTFRPAVIFKQAVRSLVGTARWLAKVAIWLGVYAVIIIPLYFIARLVYKRSKKVV